MGVERYYSKPDRAQREHLMKLTPDWLVAQNIWGSFRRGGISDDNPGCPVNWAVPALPKSIAQNSLIDIVSQQRDPRFDPDGHCHLATAGV